MITQLDTLQLPQLWCPFAPRVNPHAADAHQGTIGWLERWGLGGRTRAERSSIAEVAYLAARFHPDAPAHVLQLIADWYAWFFCQDDQCDNSDLGSDPVLLSSFHTTLLSILRGATPMPEHGSLAFALHDLKLRCQELASTRWFEQLLAQITEYFATMVWEANNRRLGIMPSLDAYVRLRPVTGGLPIEHVFARLSCNVELSQCTLYTPMVQQATMLADQVICWVNDLLSLHKEVEQGDVHNLIIILQHESQLTQAAAIDRVVTMHNAAMHRFVELSSYISTSPAYADAPMRSYIQTLQTRIAGHMDWAAAALRYKPSA